MESGIVVSAGIVPYLSIVIPIYNEADNIAPLANKILTAMKVLKKPFEVIYVDDGSTDGTKKFLELETQRFQKAASESLTEKAYLAKSSFRVISLAERGGQAHALHVGLRRCQGEIVAILDGDLQNDPADIPLLLHNLDGHGVVCGIRSPRNDNWARRFSSKIANRFRNLLTRDDIQDAGCALKVIRRSCLEKILGHYQFVGETAHYFIPTFAKIEGFGVLQINTHHYKRSRGGSKYSLIRGRVISGIAGCIRLRILVQTETKSRTK